MINKKIILIAVIILIVVIGGVLIFTNLGNKNETQKGEMTNKEQLSSQGNMVNTQENTSESKLVSDAKYQNNLSKTSYKDSNGKEYSVEDLKLPYINLNSEDAKNVNSSIEETYKKLVNNFKENVEASEQGKMTNDCTSHYNSYVNGDVLSVVIEIEYSNRLYKDYYTYNFDVNTLKLLSYEDVYKKAGFTNDNISTKVESSIKNGAVYKQYNQNEIENNIQKTVKAYNEKSLKDIGMSGIDSEYYLGYYLNKDGKLNIVIYFDIPADTGYRLDTITIE